MNKIFEVSVKTGYGKCMVEMQVKLNAGNAQIRLLMLKNTFFLRWHLQRWKTFFLSMICIEYPLLPSLMEPTFFYHPLFPYCLIPLPLVFSDTIYPTAMSINKCVKKTTIYLILRKPNVLHETLKLSFFKLKPRYIICSYTNIYPLIQTYIRSYIHPYNHRDINVIYL